MGNSRTADKFVVRLPDGVRARVDTAAQLEHNSMNTFFVQAIEEKLERAERQETMLRALSFYLAYQQWLADGNTPVSFDQWRAENGGASA
ncbi:Arc family DNA-binding protein [Ectopseudomonas oleovorans]|jgi:predicted transcriptional regulator|uniref:Arc family DNA-binding protein n=1 Tax=Ectopseudomonas oleovorans TaxID=301 RepID=A0AA42U0M1_ECTOL|nr:Arc family DNA-binding protein [Pseudomonas oleovorans]MDH1341869.1 Arc family DNA-binding protein [Pseudomonas oleovorans]MDH1490865.1 Arc family DNA-binding protein [Pseudomonas oleovorans]WGG19632.1 Arc family DNA-binding protein [Pseudomonas oleovorans]